MKITMRRLSIILLLAFTIVTGCGGSQANPTDPADQANEENPGNADSVETGETVSITSIRLVKIDGTEMELTAGPVPRKVSVRATFSVAISETTDRSAIEAAISIADPSGIAVSGTFAWSADFIQLTYTPAGRFDYGTDYTVNVDDTALPTQKMSKAYEGPDSFTTMALGDVNGDGYSDLLLGADSAPNGTGPGRAYIFYGSASGIGDKDLSAASTDTIISGAVNGDGLGASLAFAGDLNGDGYADIIVGAPYADGGGSGRGEVYAFLGSASGIADCNLAASCSPLATITGATDNGDFAYSLSGAGDVNGDGYDDIIIGEYYYDIGPGNEPGAAHVFYGGPGLAGNLSAASDTNAMIVGDAHGDYTGWSVGSAGDVNGDGYDDVIVASNGTSPYYVSIFHGSQSFGGAMTPAANEHSRLIGPGSDSFGRSVNGAGDIDGDGYDDVVVGASFANNTGTLNTGSAYIYLGSADGVADCDAGSSPDCPHAKIVGAMTEGKFGCSVASAGDTNGDGFDDVIIGADHQTSVGQSFAYLFVGSASGIVDCDMKGTPGCSDAAIGSKATSDQLGKHVNGAGDIDGDGLADIVLGAPLADGGGSNRGEAYVINGASGGIADCNLAVCTPATTVTGAANSDRLGYSVH